MSYEVTLVAVYFSTLYAYILLMNLANCVVCCALVTSLSMLEFIFPIGECPVTMGTYSLRIFFRVVSSHDIEQCDFTR